MLKHVLLAACLLTAACAYQPHYEFVAAYSPLSGPEVAKGALIWSHGTNGPGMREAKYSSLPAFISLFRDAGWDIYRMNRDAMDDNEMTRRPVAAALAAHAAELKKAGYRRIVLAGQSAGGWASIMGLGESADVDAAIALAPGCCGSGAGSAWSYWTNMNRSGLDAHLEEITHGRIVVFFPLADPYYVAGRAADAERILTEHGIAHVVIDHPPALRGHVSGKSAAFAQRYGGCLLAFAAGDAKPYCDGHAVAAH